MTKNLTTNEFIERARRKHGDKYDYSKVIYKNSLSPVTIVCPIHGEFLCLPVKHIRKMYNGGCIQCTKIIGPDKSRKSIENFKQQSRKIHGNKYTYDNVIYINNDTKVLITCPEHGDFLQKPRQHTSGAGCQMCSSEINIWTYTDWEKAGKNSKNFDGFKVYIVKLWDDNEAFVKIGKTFVSFENRFNVHIPYNWEVLLYFKGSALSASKAERVYHKNYSRQKYIPKKKFNGSHECFTMDGFEELKSEIPIQL